LNLTVHGGAPLLSIRRWLVLVSPPLTGVRRSDPSQKCALVSIPSVAHFSQHGLRIIGVKPCSITGQWLIYHFPTMLPVVPMAELLVKVREVWLNLGLVMPLEGIGNSSSSISSWRIKVFP
jgi:hypothetical protein